MDDTLAEAESQRTTSRFHGQSNRLTPVLTIIGMELELASVAIVANAEVMDGKINVGNELMCPLSKMIPSVVKF